MAAPMRSVHSKLFQYYNSVLHYRRQLGGKSDLISRGFSGKSFNNGTTGSPLRKLAVAGACLTVAAAYGSDLYKKAIPTHTATSSTLPNFKPIRVIRHEKDDSGLKLILFQYESCPFCCKVRAYLDYRGFSYNVVEVNSVWRKETKWSKYKKVPILLCQGQGENGFLQLNDSSVVISTLESYLVDKSHSLENISSFYPSIETKNSRGKTVLEFPNKYFIMYGEQDTSSLKTTAKEQMEERRWRNWTDDVLVHMLSPNVYRSPKEALEAFNYFSEVGDWKKVFSTSERLCVIYAGAAVMFIIGKMLKKKYNLKDDVRQSLYDSASEWTRAVGKQRKFMGGESPNLADLAVFGVLSSIEGCSAFKDLLCHSDIGQWYSDTKSVISQYAGQRVN